MELPTWLEENRNMEDFIGEELTYEAKTRNDPHSKTFENSGALEHQNTSPESQKNPKPAGPNA